MKAKVFPKNKVKKIIESESLITVVLNEED